MRVVLCTPHRREPAKPRELRWRDGLEWMTIGETRAGLHLDKRNDLTLRRDDVDFALPATPVSVENAVPRSREVLRGEVLAAEAERYSFRYVFLHPSMVERGRQLCGVSLDRWIDSGPNRL